MFYRDDFYHLSPIISQAGSPGNIADGTHRITMAVLALLGYDVPSNIGEPDSDSDADFDPHSELVWISDSWRPLHSQ
jgi:hypothetical protein